MKYFSFLFALTLFCFANTAQGAGQDSLWLYPNDFFSNISVRDTSSDSVVYHPMADTGDTLQGEYINYDYQFTNGSAGFKILWNYGAAFDPEIFYTDTFAEFDSLIFWYKGPLSTHTVTVSLGGSAGCGDAVQYDSIGTLSPVSSWTRAALSIPAAVKTDAQNGIYTREMRFLVYNGPGVTSLTSARGNFKIDNMFMIRPSSSPIRTKYTAKHSICTRSYFIPGASENVQLSIYSVQGALLYSKNMAVSAGIRYNVRDFATSNSGLFAPQMHLIKITGNGINITDNVWR